MIGEKEKTLAKEVVTKIGNAIKEVFSEKKTNT